MTAIIPLCVLHDNFVAFNIAYHDFFISLKAIEILLMNVFVCVSQED